MRVTHNKTLQKKSLDTITRLWVSRTFTTKNYDLKLKLKFYSIINIGKCFEYGIEYSY